MTRTPLPPDFLTLKTPRSFGHESKRLAGVLLDNDAELASYQALAELRALLPAGDKWTEVRYRVSPPNPARMPNLRRIVEITEQIASDVQGGTDAP